MDDNEEYDDSEGDGDDEGTQIKKELQWFVKKGRLPNIWWDVMNISITIVIDI